MGIRRPLARAASLPSEDARHHAQQQQQIAMPPVWKRQATAPVAGFKRQDSNTPTVFSDDLAHADYGHEDDEDEDSLSGWVYVADITGLESRRRRIRRRRRGPDFQLRYCRLRELVCTFFATEADAGESPPPPQQQQHVVIAAERTPERNKTFVVTDYEDRRLLLHTTIDADFDAWFAAFHSAIRVTQVAKASSAAAADGRRRNFTCPGGEPPPSLMLRDGSNSESRLRSFTAPLPVAHRGRRDEPRWATADDRTATAWLYMEKPWWRPGKYSRRYFVLTGRTLSCFSVNKEGLPATFTSGVLGCRYSSQSTDADLFLASGRTLHVTVASHRVRHLSDFVQRISDAVDTRAAQRRAAHALPPRPPPAPGGFV